MSTSNDLVRKRYNRFAPIYDAVEGFMEDSGASGWRELLWSKINGRELLELGVGTGRNFPFYPADVRITAVDFAEKMLDRAMKKAKKQGLSVKLELMDVQDMDFKDNTFDCAVASFVFCSVPDPVRGLKEIARVCKPEGKVVLLEHVLSNRRAIARFMNLLNPVAVALGGENINRRTEENVVKSGLAIERVTDLAAGIVKIIEARKRCYGESQSI